MEKIDKLTPIFLFLGLVALFGVYVPAFSGPFLLDDHSNIPQTKLNQFSWDGLYQVAMSNSSGVFGRPLAVATFALNHLFAEGSTFAFKLTNWLLHALNSFLVYLFSVKLFDLTGSRHSQRPTVFHCRLAALLVAGIWAFHPLQVSTVMYVVQRMTQFSTMFVLLALISYLYGRARLQRGEKALLPMSFGMLVFGTLACLSKETGLLIPLYVLLIEWVVFGYRLDNPKRRIAYRIFHGVFVAVPLFLGAILFLHLLPRLLSGYRAGETDFTLVERLLTQPIVVMEYLSVILIPNINSMSLYHDSTPVQQMVTGPVVLAILGIGLMGLCVLIGRSKVPLLAVGIGLFLISHSLESTFLPLEMKFEHRNYLGLLGIALPFAWYLIALLNRVGLRTISATAVLVTMSLLGFQTHSRATVWGDDLHFHVNSVSNDPESYRARTWFAVSLVRSNKAEQAIEQFKIAEAIDVDEAYPALGVLQARCAASEFSADDYSHALERLGSLPVTLDVVTTLLNIAENQLNGFCSRPDQAEIIELYDVAAENPKHLLQGFAKAAFAEHYGSLLFRSGQIDRGMTVFERSLEADRNNVELLWRYTLKLFQIERYADAQLKLNELLTKNDLQVFSYKKRMARMQELLDDRKRRTLELAEDVEK